MTMMKSSLLQDFKKQLETQISITPEAPKPLPKPEIVLDDAMLFAQATQGVKRLKVEARAKLTTPKKVWDSNVVARRAAAEGVAEMNHEALSDTVALLNPVSSEAILSFRRTGIQQGLFKKLKDGQLVWRAAVDLHGCTVEQAREALLTLIHDAQADGVNIIKIVHGKGYSKQENTQAGLLKTCVNGWLQQHRMVLAFHSAPPKDGGNGAVLVLLKKLPSERQL
ncbi:MAG: Smr/MutS family protein [Moraxellaceae bacterium]|nr:Smr/MutS family protein [Moraxellaceae bacterium]